MAEVCRGAINGVFAVIAGVLVVRFTQEPPPSPSVSIQGGGRHQATGGGEPRTVDVAFHATAGSPTFSATLTVVRPKDNRRVFRA